MKADHFDQQELLALAAEDVALSQLAHRRRTLPENAAVEIAAEKERELAAAVVRAETEVRDLQREVGRLEGDVETVRARVTRDQGLLDSDSVSAKQMTDLQHEIQSLARRKSDLEAQKLELMEQLKPAEATPAEARRGQETPKPDLRRAEQWRAAALADIAKGRPRPEAARTGAAAGIPAALLAD